MVASSAPAFPVSHSLTGARHGRPLPLLPLPGRRKSGWADPRCFTMRRRRLQWSACILGILGVQWPGKQFICLKFVSSLFYSVQATWATNYPDYCAGDKQSPIDLDSSKAVTMDPGPITMVDHTTVFPYL